MSLRSKVVILLSAVVLLYAVLDHVLQRTFVYGTFLALEHDSADKNMTRVTNAIDAEITSIARDAQAWATSDDVYSFPKSSDEDVSRYTRNLAQKLEGRSIDLVYICDRQGFAVFESIHDQNGRPLVLREFPPRLMTDSHPLLQRRSSAVDPTGVEAGADAAVTADPSASGVYMTEKGPMLVAVQPVVGVKKDSHGTISNGTIIVGRFLDTTLCQELKARTETDFDVWPIDSAQIPKEAQSIIDEVSSTDVPVLQPVDDDHLSVYVSHSDIQGKPALLIRANLEREATVRGGWAVRYGLFSTIAAGLLMMLVLLNTMQRTVLRPLAQLTQHAVTIGRSDDFTRRIGPDSLRKDEVGVLAREFDSMIEKVAQSRAALVDTARAAGMSEIATGVLHNVGNVLNSVNVSATLVAQKARGAAPEDLKKVMDLLRPSADDLAGFIQRDPRGKHLYPLLDSLADQLVSEKSVLLQEVQSLTTGIEHIKELVQAQQGFAGRAGVREMLSVAQLVESALSITERGVPGSKPIEIVRELEALPACPVDRHRVMEILVNLIQNARQSLLDSSDPKPRIVVKLARTPEDKLRIEIADNGVGIPAENLARVFNHGFTTKKGGHGFGLHASANAATEMQGKLTAHSAGPGQGASFVLEFPVAPAAVAGAAA